MGIKDVSKVTKKANFSHTRKITPENRREGEKIYAFTHLEECDFLDKYPIERKTYKIQKILKYFHKNGKMRTKTTPKAAPFLKLP